MNKFALLFILLAVIGLNLGHTCRLLCLNGLHRGAPGETCHLKTQASGAAQSHECHHGRKDSEKPSPSLKCGCSTELFALADFETTVNAVKAPPSYFSIESKLDVIKPSYISADPAVLEGPPKLLA